MTLKKLIIIDGGNGKLVNTLIKNYHMNYGIILTRDLDYIKKNNINKNLQVIEYQELEIHLTNAMNINKELNEIAYIHTTCSEFIPSSFIKISTDKFISLFNSDLMVLHDVLTKIIKINKNKLKITVICVSSILLLNYKKGFFNYILSKKIIEVYIHQLKQEDIFIDSYFLYSDNFESNINKSWPVTVISKNSESNLKVAVFELINILES